MLRLEFLTTLALMVAFPNRALAVGACACFDQPRAVPAFTRSLPLNPRLFVSLPSPASRTLRLVTGNTEIPITVVEAGGGPGNFWIEPLDRLLPGVSYELIANGAALAHVETIQTVDGLDNEPPTISGIGFAPGGLADNCGPVTAAATLSVENYWDDMAVGGTTVLQLDVMKDDGTSERLLLDHPGTFQHSSIGIGTGGLYGSGTDCLGHRRVPSVEAGHTYGASVTIWDWAGNSSITTGLSFALASTESQPTASGGCSTAAGSGVRFPAGAALSIVAALAALGMSLRRRKA